MWGLAVQAQPNVHLIVLAAFCVTASICRIGICMSFHENILKHDLSIIHKVHNFLCSCHIYFNGKDFYTLSFFCCIVPVGNVQKNHNHTSGRPVIYNSKTWTICFICCKGCSTRLPKFLSEKQSSNTSLSSQLPLPGKRLSNPDDGIITLTRNWGIIRNNAFLNSTIISIWNSSSLFFIALLSLWHWIGKVRSQDVEILNQQQIEENKACELQTEEYIWLDFIPRALCVMFSWWIKSHLFSAGAGLGGGRRGVGLLGFFSFTILN